jgi:hypothetical protein
MSQKSHFATMFSVRTPDALDCHGTGYRRLSRRAAFDILLLLCVATVPSSSPKASLPAILALPAK